MKTFILAGFQRSLTKQIDKALRDHKDQFGGWNFQLFPGESSKESSISARQVDNLLQMACGESGAHIFGLSTERTRGEIEEKISPYFRFRWLETNCIGDVGRGSVEDFLARIKEALEEEDIWLCHVKPDDFSSPLILPEMFSAKGECSKIWRLSRSYGNHGHLMAASEMIKRFTRGYRRRVDGYLNTPWLDERKWIWNDEGPRHGIPAFPKNWKYSYRLPDGFHFDVSPQNNQNAVFFDTQRRPHRFSKKGYLNITVHGEVRGA
jgi:hypothetical protein